jgi:hypothetical protein
MGIRYAVAGFASRRQRSGSRAAARDEGELLNLLQWVCCRRITPEEGRRLGIVVALQKEAVHTGGGQVAEDEDTDAECQAEPAEGAICLSFALTSQCAVSIRVRFVPSPGSQSRFYAGDC